MTPDDVEKPAAPVRRPRAPRPTPTGSDPDRAILAALESAFTDPVVAVEPAPKRPAKVAKTAAKPVSQTVAKQPAREPKKNALVRRRVTEQQAAAPEPVVEPAPVPAVEQMLARIEAHTTSAPKARARAKTVTVTEPVAPAAPPSPAPAAPAVPAAPAETSKRRGMFRRSDTPLIARRRPVVVDEPVEEPVAETVDERPSFVESVLKADVEPEPEVVHEAVEVVEPEIEVEAVVEPEPEPLVEPEVEDDAVAAAVARAEGAQRLAADAAIEHARQLRTANAARDRADAEAAEYATLAEQATAARDAALEMVSELEGTIADLQAEVRVLNRQLAEAAAAVFQAEPVADAPAEPTASDAAKIVARQTVAKVKRRIEQQQQVRR